jgi:peroxiredoxin (alkyl hydroperoxide reductase subunit C)
MPPKKRKGSVANTAEETKQEVVENSPKAAVRCPAPDFQNIDAVMPDKQFKKLSLEEFKGKYLVLFFYPLDFTFVCPTEIISFSDRIKDFEKLNCAVLGASTDSKYSHLAWIETPRKKGGIGDMSFPLLADLKHTLSKDYGVYMEDAGYDCRGLFIIDGKGVIRHITMNDPPVGRNIDEVLRLVAAYQHVDVHGEVCPANWKPGSATMNADPKGSGPNTYRFNLNCPTGGWCAIAVNTAGEALMETSSAFSYSQVGASYVFQARTLGNHNSGVVTNPAYPATITTKDSTVNLQFDATYSLDPSARRVCFLFAQGTTGMDTFGYHGSNRGFMCLRV